MGKGIKRKDKIRALGRLELRAFWGMALMGLILASCATAPPSKVEMVWPMPPDPPRIRYVESIDDQKISSLGGEGITSWMDRLLGDAQGGGRKMRKPHSVTVDRQGRVYVADPGMAAVWVIDDQEKDKNARVRLIGTSGQGRLSQPVGVAVADDGRIYVSDVIQDRVFCFDPQGNLQRVIGKKDDFYNPASLAIDQKGKRLYVADAGGYHHAIHVFDLEGNRLKVIGYRGNKPGLFNYPTHLFIRGDRLYVSDTMNFRVQVLDLEGNFLHEFGEMGDGWGQLARPKGVAVDSEGHVYMVDAAFENFQVFDEKGRLLVFVGHAGHGPGEFTLPAGMYIDEWDRIYVVDSYNRRVQVFQYLGGRYKEQAEREASRQR